MRSRFQLIYVRSRFDVSCSIDLSLVFNCTTFRTALLDCELLCQLRLSFDLISSSSTDTSVLLSKYFTVII